MECSIQIDYEDLIMKILLIAPSAYLLGGVQDWLYSLTLGLRKKGYKVVVAIPNNRFHDGVSYNQYYGDIHATYFINCTGTSEGRIRALSKLLVSNPADLIINVNIGDTYEAYRRVFDKLQDTRMIMTLHAIEVDYLADIGKYHPLIDGIITTNKLSRRIVSKLNLLEENRILYAPYGVSENHSGIERDNHDELKICWVGRLDNEQKRISDLHDILVTLDKKKVPYILSIAGDGPYKPNLVRQLKAWIRDGRVKLMGVLSKEEMLAFYAKHDILLITSEWETGPIVAWEAMMAGCVVVSSQYIGYASEGALINEDTALLYQVSSEEEAAKQIARLLNPILRKELSIRGRMLAVSRYSTESSLKSWEEAFNTLVKLERRAHVTTLNGQSSKNAGRLELILGSKVSEFLRKYLKRQGYCNDAGSEWPHSTYGHANQKSLLNYAKLLEKDA